MKRYSKPSDKVIIGNRAELQKEASSKSFQNALFNGGYQYVRYNPLLPRLERR